MQVVAFAPVSQHHLIAWLFIGLVAGVLAGIVVRGGGLGFFRDIVVGLIGAVIGGLILHAVRGGAHSVVKLWQEIVVAFVGAVILLLVLKIFTRGGRSRARR